MLLSYKPLHLEAQQRLQEEGCVVDIIQQDETLAKAPGANNVGVLVLPPFRFIGLSSKSHQPR